ncbi:hypothetical protein D9M71_752020 [compost metagenome]
MLMTTSEHVTRHQMSTLGGNPEPAQRQRLILCDPSPVQQDLPEQRLGIDNPFTGRHQNRLGSTRRAFIEHGLEAFTVEHFLAAQLKTHTSTQRRNRL